MNFYKKNRNSYFENTKNINMEHIYDSFLKQIPKNGKILDCGCGSGRDSLYFKNKGYKIEAFDSSSELVELAKEYTNIDIKVNTFENYKTNDKFDGLFFMASLVHLKPNEFEQILNKFKKYLNKNGSIYISLKEGGGIGITDEKTNRFFYYWNIEELNKIFTKNKINRQFFKSKDKKQHIVQKEEWINIIIRDYKEPELNFSL